MSDQAEEAVEEEVDVEEPEVKETEDSSEDVEVEETEEEEGSEEELEFETVEINGQSYQVPKELKDNIMMQQDYTRKTQEVAETRKQLEAQQQELQQEREKAQQHNQDRRELAALDYQLEQYDNVDWSALYRDDPNAAQQHQINYTQLKNLRDKKAQQVQEEEQQALRKQQEQIAKLREESRRRLATEVPDWSSEKNQALQAQAQELGFSSQFFEAMRAGAFPDIVPIVKALDKAHRYDQMIKKASQKPKPKGEVKPTKKVQGKSPAKKSLYSKDLTPEERIEMFRKRSQKK